MDERERDRARALLRDAETEGQRAREMVNRVAIGADGDLAEAAVGQALALLALRDTIAVGIGLALLDE